MSFEIADVTKFEQRLGSFDAVFSRDMFLHIKDKASLFRRCGMTLGSRVVGVIVASLLYG